MAFCIDARAGAPPSRRRHPPQAGHPVLPDGANGALDCPLSRAMTALGMLLEPSGRGAKLFGDPVDDVVNDERAVIGAAMLGPAIGEGEDLELAIRAVDRGGVELFGVPERNLA